MIDTWRTLCGAVMDAADSDECFLATDNRRHSGRATTKNFWRTDAMKTGLISFILCGAAIAAGDLSSASLAPFDSGYIRYVEQVNAGMEPQRSADGHVLGYIPPPYKFSVYSSNNLYNAFLRDTLPVSYDLRELGFVSPVKNQGACGSCWTFGTYGSIESTWLVAGYGLYDLSENNLNYGHAYVWSPCDGGNYYTSTAYLTHGLGPISEEDDPYLGGAGNYHSGLTPQAYVTDARLLPEDSEIVKQALLTYGALGTNMHWVDNSLNSDYTYYYDGSEDINHAVTIVGWDDSLFVPEAPGVGAWIIKNSWGADWALDGYFYVSFHDTKILTDLTFWPARQDYSSNLRIHDYDVLGVITTFGWSSNMDYAVVKYQMHEDQELTSVGTYSVAQGGTVYVEVYSEFDGSTLSNMLTSTDSNFCQFAGYYTFGFSDTLEVSAGEDLFLKVAYSNPESQQLIPIEVNAPGYALPEITTGVFWGSATGSDSSWHAMGQGTQYPFDPCVKLYGQVVIPADLVARSELPHSFTLIQNFPNPFNPSTTIRYGLSEDAPVSLEIYDLRGTVVYNHTSSYHTAGWHNMVWNGQNTDGRSVSTGIYFARIVAGNQSDVIKMLFIK